MARPIKRNADYFTHDKGMRNDTRIKALRSKFSFKGYAVYNMLLEVLTDAKEFKYRLKDDVDYILLAGDFDLEESELRLLIDFMLKIRLISLEAGYLFSEKLIEKFTPLLEKRNRDKEYKLKKTSIKTVSDVDNYKVSDIVGNVNKQSKVEYSRVKINSKLFIYEAKIFFNQKERGLYSITKEYMNQNKDEIQSWLFDNFKNCTEEILDIIARNAVVIQIKNKESLSGFEDPLPSLIYSLLDFANKNLAKFPQGGQIIEIKDKSHPFRTEVNRIKNRYPELAQAKFDEAVYNSLRKSRKRVEKEIINATNIICSDLVKYRRNKANVFIEVKDSFSKRSR